MEARALTGAQAVEERAKSEDQNMKATILERRLQISALFIVFGLVIGLLTLFWTHPLAFVAFAVLGCPLVLIGTVSYLLSLLPTESPK